MDQATLVGADFATGARMLEILDDKGLRTNVALWLRTPEYDDWRFALSSRELDSLEPSVAYGRIHNSLGEGGLSLEHTPPLMILRTSDPFIRTLRRYFGKPKGIEGMRLGGQALAAHVSSKSFAEKRVQTPFAAQRACVFRAVGRRKWCQPPFFGMKLL